MITSIPFTDIKLGNLGWAFIVFCAGSGLLMLVSFIACFASPNNPLGGYIFHNPSIIVTQTGSNPYQPMDNSGPVAPGFASHQQFGQFYPMQAPAMSSSGVTVVATN